MYLRLFDPLRNHYILECQAGGFSKRLHEQEDQISIYIHGCEEYRPRRKNEGEREKKGKGQRSENVY